MQNAHLRLGRLEYIKPPVSTKATATHIAVTMDRVIVEPPPDSSRAPRCHLLSVFGGEQEMTAIHAAIADQAKFRIAGPGLPNFVVCLGEHSHTFRGFIQIPGRKQAVRHLVGLSQELFETQAGGNAGADRTIVYNAEPEFLAYRLGVRFGFPVLPHWSEWICDALLEKQLIQELSGINCRPVLVTADKKYLLTLIAGALRTGALTIPEDASKIDWKVPHAFGCPEA